MVQEETPKKDYEISILAKDEAGIEEVRSAIQKEEGEITLENPAERIVLSYKIKKENSALFSFFHFRISPDKIGPLENALRMKNLLIRFLIITPPFVKNRQKPSPRAKQSAPPQENITEKKNSPPEPLPLSNEALEKKIEEILQK